MSTSDIGSAETLKSPLLQEYLMEVKHLNRIYFKNTDIVRGFYFSRCFFTLNKFQIYVYVTPYL